MHPKYPIETLIDPCSNVINSESSIPALQLIHRALLSHLGDLIMRKPLYLITLKTQENWQKEWNSTSQLASDVLTKITSRSHE